MQRLWRRRESSDVRAIVEMWEELYRLNPGEAMRFVNWLDNLNAFLGEASPEQAQELLTRVTRDMKKEKG